LTIYTSNDAVSRKEVPFGGSNASKGSFPQKPQKFRPGIGIFSLNKSMNNFSTVHAIFLKLAQSTQPGERNSKLGTKSPKFRSKGRFFGKNAPNDDFQPKHPVE
jgi:hypothetical protein